MEGTRSIFATWLHLEAPPLDGHDHDFGTGANPRFTMGGCRPASAFDLDDSLRGEVCDRPAGLADQAVAPDRLGRKPGPAHCRNCQQVEEENSQDRQDHPGNTSPNLRLAGTEAEPRPGEKTRAQNVQPQNPTFLVAGRQKPHRHQGPGHGPPSDRENRQAEGSQEERNSGGNSRQTRTDRIELESGDGETDHEEEERRLGPGAQVKKPVQQSRLGEGRRDGRYALAGLLVVIAGVGIAFKMVDRRSGETAQDNDRTNPGP